MNELALFSGGGGGLLATKWILGWATVCYVEWEQYCIDLTVQRIKDGLLDDAPIWDDARTFDGRPWAGCVDIVTAGFPCQPHSCAGKQLGADDERDMWPATARIVRECRPRAVLLENVPGLIWSGYILTVLDDLSQAGYKALPPVRLAASDVGANHPRARVWIVAYADGGCSERTAQAICPGRPFAELCSPHVPDADGPDQGRGQLSQREQAQRDAQPPWDGTQGEVAYADTTRLEERETEGQQATLQAVTNGGWWDVEPPLGRVVDGFPNRVDQCKAIGNAQVPAVVATVWRLLTDPIL